MIKFTKIELENIAHLFVEKYYDVMRHRGFRTVERIEPKIMLRNVLGLDIQYHILSRNGSILGFTIGSYCEVDVFDGGGCTTVALDGNTVFIDSEQAKKNKGRENFTLMHEGAHQLLRKLFPESYECGVKVCRFINSNEFDPEESQEEWQADYIASILLMPKEIVLAAMKHFYVFVRNERSGKMEYQSMTRKSFYELADYLGVSHQALRIRIKELGLKLINPPSCVIECASEEDL